MMRRFDRCIGPMRRQAESQGKRVHQEKTRREIQDIFEQRVGRPDRRPYDLTLLPPDNGLRTMLEGHQRRVESWMASVRSHHVPTMHPVHFCYIENLKMNAFAFKVADDGFIGVYSGTVLTVQSFFGALLSHPSFLRSIGNPDAEVEWTGFKMTPQPKDPARNAYAHLLSTLAVDFLFMHEIAHLMNGHVEFDRNRRQTSVFWEFAEAQGSTEDNLTSQTLEMDADADATLQGLTIAFGRTSDVETLPEAWRPWFRTPRLALYTWILAAYGFFRLFFGGETAWDGLLRTSHPPHNIRLGMVLKTIVAILQRERRDKLLSELNPIIAELVPEMERAHAWATSTAVDDSGIRTAVDPRAAKHTGILLEHWKVIRPELVPHARGVNLAP
jgi:hypothetical protein